VRSVQLAFDPGYFVFDSELFALQFGNFLVRRGGVRESICKFGLERFVLCCQLTEVSLK
jgi:hypothetical protein